MQQDLVLDVGNTRTKAALFLGSRVVRMSWLPTGDHQALKHWLGEVLPKATVVGSVAHHDPQFMAHLRSWGPALEVTGATPSPLRNAYGTPLTLGADRLANAVGAASCFPGRAVLAIDAGTCITCDLVEADGTYRGGTIAPGLRMRAQAMHAYSARLPLVEPAEAPPFLGGDTRASLEAGIHHGIVGELRWSIERFGYERPGMAVVLAGGDAPRFARALKSGIFAHPLLTLIGLHAILLYNRALDPALGSLDARGDAGPRAAG